MKHDPKKQLNYWDDPKIESMYDKHLLNSEINIIKKQLEPNSSVLDAGCGEGEGTFSYSSIKNISILGADFSNTRLEKATKRLKRKKNVTLKKIDFLSEVSIKEKFDFVISQRFVINILEWDLQKKVIDNLMKLVKKGGKILFLEGSNDGVNELNALRSEFELDPIPVRFHNLFFNDSDLEKYFISKKFKLVEKDGLGTYFFLTRGIRPAIEKDINWQSNFNKNASKESLDSLVEFGEKFSRLKLWVFKKI